MTALVGTDTIGTLNSHRRDRSDRRWARRIGLFLLGTALPLIVLEVVAQLFGPVLPGNYSTGTFLTTHPVYGRFHVPDFDGWVKTDEFASHVTINSLGLRGPERPYAKPPGVRRILILGDSFTEAAQVSEQEGVVSRLEQILNAGDGPVYEVMNGGIGGWGTGQELLFLQTEGYRYQPDLVIVLFYVGNDVYDNSWELQGRPSSIKEPYFTFQDDGAFAPLAFHGRRSDDVSPAMSLLRSHTMLWNIFETGILQKLSESQADTDLRANRFNLNKMLIHAVKASDRQDAAWRITLTLLQRIRQFDDTQGVETVVVVAPAAYQVYDTDWTALLQANSLRRDQWSATLPDETLASNSLLIGAPMLDLLPSMRAEAETGSSLYFPYNKHWTPAGHNLAAQAIAAFLAERERSR